MNPVTNADVLVVDASIAVKWVVEEEGTAVALALRERARLIAPELLVADCANIFAPTSCGRKRSDPSFQERRRY